ncbi:S8 family serine peptidase [Actinoallomurus purpureus]|uniref:S8 family serine peptidase n=1 Tax=Actinoallomurus purpureus TaxID=478114 RepID=UPI002093D321|nr:S8 family serine peptidase [Actinoallomurus purpureus]MCO6006303.1 S8 family serine peptidase [Actinoallomurus purpureus]
MSTLIVMSSVLITTPPAYSETRPRAEEWWFGTWDIQEKVWPITNGKGVTVAVIDSGVNARLPELRGAVIPGADMDAGKGDGRTDFDTQENGHGTAMAALIAGQGAGSGMVGVAPGAKILPIRAKAGNREIENGIRYAVDHGASVINISQGVPSPDWVGCGESTQQTISYALNHDVVIVASAGNDGDGPNDKEWPAECRGVLAVGAVDHTFNPWVKTQRQPYVMVAAPGVRAGSVNKSGEFVPVWNGTSQASALTSGVVALVRSKFPKMSAGEVVQRITSTARDVGAPGRDDATGYGLVRPYHALVDKATGDVPNPLSGKWNSSGASKIASGESKPSRAPVAVKTTGRPNRFPIYVAAGGAMAITFLALYATLKRKGRRRIP